MRQTSVGSDRRWFTGFTPGLPARLRVVPFGHDSWEREAFGLSTAQLAAVVCLCAATICGRPDCTVRELLEKTGYRAQGFLRELQRKCWVEFAGKRGHTQYWRATPRAVERLGLKRWEPELVLAEQQRWSTEGLP